MPISSTGWSSSSASAARIVSFCVCLFACHTMCEETQDYFFGVFYGFLFLFISVLQNTKLTEIIIFLFLMAANCVLVVLGS